MDLFRSHGVINQQENSSSLRNHHLKQIENTPKRILRAKPLEDVKNTIESAKKTNINLAKNTKKVNATYNMERIDQKQLDETYHDKEICDCAMKHSFDIYSKLKFTKDELKLVCNPLKYFKQDSYGGLNLPEYLEVIQEVPVPSSPELHFFDVFDSRLDSFLEDLEL